MKAARLDEIIPASYPIKFIKIDVEGAELQVLRGAVDTLKRNLPTVVFEHGLGAADCYGTEPQMVFDLFAECGLRCFTMEMWLSSHAVSSLSRKQFCEEFSSGKNFYFMASH